MEEAKTKTIASARKGTGDCLLVGITLSVAWVLLSLFLQYILYGISYVISSYIFSEWF